MPIVNRRFHSLSAPARRSQHVRLAALQSARVYSSVMTDYSFVMGVAPFFRAPALPQVLDPRFHRPQDLADYSQDPGLLASNARIHSALPHTLSTGIGTAQMIA